VLPARLPTVQEVQPASVVATAAQDPPLSRYSMSKPVSSSELSVHERPTLVEFALVVVSPEGALGGPGVLAVATLPGDDRPFDECFARTRKA